MQYTGELAALGAAAAWATSTLLYRRLGTAIPPLALNFVKGVVATPMLVATLLLWPAVSSGLDGWGFAMLALSGAIGIGVGDTAFFAALNRLGERRTILMAETLAPPMTAGIAWVVLSEMLPRLAVLGIAITIAGVSWVVVERSHETTVEPAAWRRGVVCGLVAAGCQAVGAVLSRSVMAESEVSPVLSSLVRILSGVLVLLVWMPMVRERYVPPALLRPGVWRGLLVAIFLGTFLGLCMQQVSLSNTSAAITQTLIATSAIFVLPLVWLQGERVGLRAWLGAGIAVAGVALLFLN